MGNVIKKTTELAMFVTLRYVGVGDTVVDATCGGGNDTVSLSKAVGSDGRVYAFDIQKEAINRTEKRLKESGFRNVSLIKDSFEAMGEYLPDNTASAVVFNLGYLPGGDHSITTETEQTLKGLDAALRIIKKAGVVTVVLYDGHEEGIREKSAVLEWAASLDERKYHAAYVKMLNQKNNPPEIMWITK